MLGLQSQRRRSFNFGETVISFIIYVKSAQDRIEVLSGDKTNEENRSTALYLNQCFNEQFLSST